MNQAIPAAPSLPIEPDGKGTFYFPIQHEKSCITVEQEPLTSPEEIVPTELEAPQLPVPIPAEHESLQSDGEGALANSNDLETISDEIRHHKKQAETSFLEMGRLLLEAKEMVKHGEWIPWLRDNFDMSQRTAQKLMELSREFGKASSISFLGFTKASMLVTLPRQKREGFLSNFHEIRPGEEKSIEDMTTKQFGKAVQAYKKRTSSAKQLLFSGSRNPSHIPAGEALDPVKVFEDKLLSLDMRLGDVVSQIFDVEGDLDIRIELYDSLCDLLNKTVSDLRVRRREMEADTTLRGY